jgi:hypothetical protein
MDVDTQLEATEPIELDEIREASWIAEQAELLAREEGFAA